MRLYAVRANKPGIGSSGDTALPFGYCWECEELFKVDIELEQLRPRRAESPPSNRAADPSRRRANGDTVNEDPRYRESVSLPRSRRLPPTARRTARLSV